MIFKDVLINCPVWLLNLMMKSLLYGCLTPFPIHGKLLESLLTNTAPKGKVTMEYLKSSVLNEDTRLRMQGISLHSDTLIVEHKGRNKYRGKDKSNKGRSRSKK
jgi:hypothetical protein